MTHSTTAAPSLLALTEQVLEIALARTACREDLWTEITQQTGATSVLEVGVWKGAFAAHMLKTCCGISRYYMIDSWASLPDWNKPWNVDESTFQQVFAAAMAATEFAESKRVILRGRTVDVIDAVPDEAIDLAYIDGDHTLRGIAIDLVRTYPKIRRGGIVGGDDFTPSIWQHADTFEPTLVCPFAAYFAESQGAPLIIFPHNQFAILKPVEPGRHFRIIDTTNNYGSMALLPQIARRP